MGCIAYSCSINSKTRKKYYYYYYLTKKKKYKNPTHSVGGREYILSLNKKFRWGKKNCLETVKKEQQQHTTGSKK